MEALAIVILAVLALALGGALIITWQRNNAGREQLDPHVAEMKAELNKVSELVRELEKDRENKFGQLTNQLKTVGEQTNALATTTGKLREALASTRIRGQWGERMAEDVLRLVGFVEGVNYLKQATIECSGTRPDYTFLLPQNLKLNMDVKFPLDNYQKCIEAEDGDEENRYRQMFLRDVRARMKEVVTRDYIDPGQKTLDYVLLFIPNEQIYQYMHEQDSLLIGDALSSKVVLCSPVSLFAILVVIRQAVDNFAVEQSSNEIISELGVFNKQWGMFVDRMDSLGKRIESAQKEYTTLVTTRKRALERPLNRIEIIRQQRLRESLTFKTSAIMRLSDPASLRRTKVSIHPPTLSSMTRTTTPTRSTRRALVTAPLPTTIHLAPAST